MEIKKEKESYKQVMDKKKLIPPHPSTNFEIQKYQNEPTILGKIFGSK